MQKGYIRNPATCACGNGRYAGSIIEESTMTYDEIIELVKCILTKTVPSKNISTNLNDKRSWRIYVFYLPFYKAFSISFFIKYQAKQKYLLTF